jgi:hypothetical protein
MGMKSAGNTVYIIDFGLSKRYRDPRTLVHIPWKSNKSLTGILEYYCWRQNIMHFDIFELSGERTQLEICGCRCSKEKCERNKTLLN